MARTTWRTCPSPWRTIWSLWRSWALTSWTRWWISPKTSEWVRPPRFHSPPHLKCRPTHFILNFSYLCSPFYGIPSCHIHTVTLLRAARYTHNLTIGHWAAPLERLGIKCFAQGQLVTAERGGSVRYSLSFSHKITSNNSPLLLSPLDSSSLWKVLMHLWISQRCCTSAPRKNPCKRAGPRPRAPNFTYCHVLSLAANRSLLAELVLEQWISCDLDLPDRGGGGLDALMQAAECEVMWGCPAGGCRAAVHRLLFLFGWATMRGGSGETADERWEGRFRTLSFLWETAPPFLTHYD